MRRTMIFWLVFVILAVGIAVQGKAQQGRYSKTSETQRVGKDIYFATKTVNKTISLNDDDSVDDFQFDDDAANSNAQVINLGSLIPVFAEVVSAQIRCFESVGAGTFQVKLGTGPGFDQIFGFATVDAAGEIVSTPAGESPELAAIDTGSELRVVGDPSGNWTNAGDAGRWIVTITYIDYGAVYDADVP